MKRLFPVANRIQNNRTKEESLTENEEVFIIIEAKKKGKGLQTLFTHEHFREMIELDEFINNLNAPAEMAQEIGVDSIGVYDLCKKDNITDEVVVYLAGEACEAGDDRYCLPDIPEKCAVTQRPLDFIYDRKTDSFDLSKYDDDEDLIRKIQSGKGDETFMYYEGKSLYIELIFGGTIPEEPE